MHKGIATVSVSGTLEDKLQAISAAKFDGIELFDNDLVASHLRPGDVAKRCADLGLSIDLFQPVRDVEGLTGDAFIAAERRFRWTVLGRHRVSFARTRRQTQSPIWTALQNSCMP